MEIQAKKDELERQLRHEVEIEQLKLEDLKIEGEHNAKQGQLKSRSEYQTKTKDPFL